jgi:2'-5' RNA ligase
MRLVTSPEREVEVENAIRDAYQSMPRGALGFVTIADLRERLGDDYPRVEVDNALVRLQRKNNATLFPESNQKTLTARDDAAAVIVGNESKHAIRFTASAAPAVKAAPSSAPPAARKVAAAKRAPRAAKAPRPSGLPTDRRPESGDFDELADRITGRTGAQILETIQDLNASELARLARKFDGDALHVPGTLKVSGRRQGIKLPAKLSLDEKRRWLARKLTERRDSWRSAMPDSDDLFRADAEPDNDDDDPTGAMVALLPSKEDASRLAVEGGENAEQLHATLLFLGDAAEISDEDRQSILDAAQSVVDSLGGPVEADGFALSLFNPTGEDPCIVLGLTGSELADAHTLATDEVENVFDVPDQHEPYAPHVTLEYTDDATKIADLVAKVGPLAFDRLRVAFGTEVHDLPLGGTVGRSMSFSDKPWSQFTQADYTPEQWRKACLIHEDPAEGQDPDAKSLGKLPVAEPDGTLNRNGIHAAAGRLHAVSSSAEMKQAAAKKLVALYRQMDEEPPDSLLAEAGVTRAESFDDDEILRYAAASPWTKDDESKHPRGKGAQGGQFVSTDQADQHVSVYTQPGSARGPAKKTQQKPAQQQRQNPQQAKPGQKPTHPAKGQKVDSYTKKNDRTVAKRRTLLPGEGVGRKGGDPDVRGLQQALNALGLANLRPNGVFGDNTEAAVMEAQKRLGLRPNGHVSSSLLRKLNDASKLSNCAQRSQPLDGIEDAVRAMSTANMPMAPTGHVAYVDGRDEPFDEVDFTDGGSVCAYADHVAVKLDDTEAVRFTPDEARKFADAVDNADATAAHVAGASVSTDDSGDYLVRFGTDGVDLDPDEASDLAEGLRDMADAVEEEANPDETEPDMDTDDMHRSTVDYYTSGDGRDEWLMSATPWSILQDRLEPELGTLASIEMATRCVVDTYTGGDRG